MLTVVQKALGRLDNMMLRSLPGASVDRCVGERVGKGREQGRVSPTADFFRLELESDQPSEFGNEEPRRFALPASTPEVPQGLSVSGLQCADEAFDIPLSFPVAGEIEGAELVYQEGPTFLPPRHPLRAPTDKGTGLQGHCTFAGKPPSLRR